MAVEEDVDVVARSEVWCRREISMAMRRERGALRKLKMVALLTRPGFLSPFFATEWYCTTTSVAGGRVGLGTRQATLFMGSHSTFAASSGSSHPRSVRCSLWSINP